MSDVQLANDRAHTVTLSTLGAAITSIKIPHEVTVAAGSSAGKSIGRYANRIARGRLVIDGVAYQLAVNENGNALHGGPDGFSKREWALAAHSRGEARFDLSSPAGDQGFPGALQCSATYTWSDDDELSIVYRAQTSAPTVVNFTNHVYFNLRGGGSTDEYALEIPASRYVVLDEQLIPTGELAPVEGSGTDFRDPASLDGRTIDRNFVLDDWAADGVLRFAGRLHDPQTGRAIEVRTTQPGFQLYTGKPEAVAMEMQHFPDAPNHPNFPSTLLRPGETFQAEILYRFRE